MFSQNLGSSPESTWRKLGSMLISCAVHSLALAVMFGFAITFTHVVLVEESGSLVATLTFTPRPGDSRQMESRPNAWHSARPEMVSLPANTGNKIQLPALETVEPINGLLVIAPVAPIYSIDHGHQGLCGCVGYHEPLDRPVLIRQSRLKQAMLVKKIDPQYPEFALRAGIQGAVVVHAIVDRDGKVTSISVVSGPDELRGAAIEAIRQWRYEPYVLDGRAVEIETTITVNFVLPKDQRGSRMI